MVINFDGDLLLEFTVAALLVTKNNINLKASYILSPLYIKSYAEIKFSENKMCLCVFQSSICVVTQ